MKRLALFLFAVVLAAAPAEEKAKPKPAAKAASIKVPEGARRVDHNTWEHTDSSGKRWLYRETPFGVTRLDDKEKREPVRKDTKGAIAKVEDVGDTVRFERPGPFGPYRWEKKKSELNEEEQTAWNKSRKEKD